MCSVIEIEKDNIGTITNCYTHACLFCTYIKTRLAVIKLNYGKIACVPDTQVQVSWFRSF